GFPNRPLNFRGVIAPALRVEVRAVRFVVRDGYLRPEFAQNAWRRFVGGAVRHIDSDAHLLERHTARETRFGKFNVTAKGVINPRGAPDVSGSRPNGIDFSGKNKLLDLFFYMIVQLVAVVPEKFDAIIFVRIVRSGENDAGIGTQRSRDVSHTGRRQRTDDENIYPERGDSGDERVFEHVLRKTRVLVKDDFRKGPLRVIARVTLCGEAYA